MLLDASVVRSFAVVGWTRQLIQVCGGTVLIADGVHGADPEDPSELRRIQVALQRQVDQSGYGSGLAGRGLAAVQGLDELLALGPDELTVWSRSLPRRSTWQCGCSPDGPRTEHGASRSARMPGDSTQGSPLRSLPR